MDECGGGVSMRSGGCGMFFEIVGGGTKRMEGERFGNWGSIPFINCDSLI